MKVDSWSMLFPRLRPRLERNVALTPPEIASRVNAMLASPEKRIRGFANARQIELLVPAREARFWSPQLLINLEATPTGSALVGHFQPNGNVWTMFMACYGFAALCGLTGLLLGMSQWMVQEFAWGLLLPPIAMVVIIGLYLASGVGQRLGADQVEILERVLEDALQSRIEPTSENSPELNPPSTA